MRNKILKTITSAAACGFLLFAAGCNENTTKEGWIICLIGAAACGAWLLLFSKANPEYEFDN